MSNIQREHKMLVSHKHLNVIAHRDLKDGLLRFYVLSNRLLVNGKQSEIEVEVWLWHDDRPFDDPNKITRIEHEIDVEVIRLAKE
jgi:hypothetical protein